MSIKVIFKILHVLVALIAVIACVVLAFSTEGHPPGFVLIPFVIVYWIITHLVLLALKWFMVYMAKPKENTATLGWPPILTLIVVIGGLLLSRILYSSFQGLVVYSHWPELKEWIWVIMIFIPPVCLFGGLVYGAITGSKYARWIAAAGPIAYIGYCIAHIVNGSAKPSVFEIIIVFGFCIALSSYLLFSSRVQVFFASRS